MTDVKVSVLLDVIGADQFDRVAEQARAAGFRLDAEGRLVALPALIGSIDSEAIDRLRAIPGVRSVETHRENRAQGD